MTPVLPREHGAWGILLVPFLTAAGIAGVFSPAVVLALLAVVLAFLARTPLSVWLLPGAGHRQPALSAAQARRWTFFYGGPASLVGVVLVVVWRFEDLLVLAALALGLFFLHLLELRRGGPRGWVAELLGTGALTLSAPVAWVAATGALDSNGLLVWLLNAAFFCTGLVYVKARIGAVGAGRHSRVAAPQNAARAVLFFHLVVVAFVAALIAARWASPLVILPFLVATARAGWGTRRFGQRFAVRRLGWNEVAHSLVFALLLVAAFRL